MVWQRIKLILSASMCVFNGGFMRLGPDFSCFGHHLLRYLWSREKLNAVPNCFQTVTIFFPTACFFDIILSMSPQVLAKYATFSTVPWWYFKG